MRNLWKRATLLLAFAAGGALSGVATAAPSVPTTCGVGCVHFTGSGPSDPGGSTLLSAEVFFQQSGTELFVTLINTGLEAVKIPSDILTGVFFTLMSGSSLITLNPLTAFVADRPDAQFPNTKDARLVNHDNSTFSNALNINVGGEFAYNGGSGFDFHGAKAGISASGLSEDPKLELFGQGNFCNGGKPGSASCPNIAGPGSVDGMQLGIVPFAGFAAKLANGIDNHNPYVQSSVQFKLGGLPTGFTLTSGALSSVGFQYGTSLDQPHFAPAPATIALVGLGCVLLAGFTGRRRPS